MATIRSKKELSFYIQADRMMNRGCFKYSIAQKIKYYLLPDYIMQYLEALRKCSFYSQSKSALHTIQRLYYKTKLYRLGMKLGYDIGCDVLGYGVVIGHPGTIVIGSSNRIGNYAVLHTSTYISNNGKTIGDGLYLAAGSIITTKIQLGNNISIGANSLVNRSFNEDNMMIAGSPAVAKKETDAWYKSDGGIYYDRYQAIEKLRIDYGYKKNINSMCNIQF